MRTSGSGNRDLAMMGVPFAILVVYGLMTGGGLTNVLRMLERNLWTAAESVMLFFS